MPCPRRRNRDKPGNKACACCNRLFFDGTSRNQATHTVSDNVTLFEVVAFSQQFQPGRRGSRYPFQTHSARIMEEPNLVSPSIEVLRKVAPILGSPANAVNKQDRDTRRIIGLRKIDAGAMFTQESKGAPQATSSGVSREILVIQRNNFS